MQFNSSIKKFEVAEYLLLIQPRKDLSDSIVDIKKYFYNKYKAEEALRGKPHITLVNFVQYTTFEERIRQELRTISLSKAPFQINLLDYGSFPCHTIYINILSRPVIQSLVKTIRTEAQSLMKSNSDNRPHFILEPHLTIARKLKPWQYEQGWLEFNNKNFSGKFVTTSMILLRRNLKGGKYEQVERFEFLNIPVIAKQTAMF